MSKKNGQPTWNPGWYDDGHGQLRYWDGSQWTEQTTPLPPVAPTAQTSANPVPPAEGPGVPPLYQAPAAGAPGAAELGPDMPAGAAAPTKRRSRLLSKTKNRPSGLGWTLIGAAGLVLIIIIASVSGGGSAPSTASGTGTATPAAADTQVPAAPKSSAPAPKATTAPVVDKVTMPNLVGKDGATAEKTLDALGITSKFDAGDDVVILASNWNVTSQSIPAGWQITKDTEVTLKVAKPVEDTTVTYTITSNAPLSTITYDDDGNTGQASDAPAPWTKSVTKHTFGSYYVSAQMGDGGTTVTCTISTGGKVVATQTSTGAYSIASCTY